MEHAAEHWQDVYRDKIISPQEAAGLVRSGDNVLIGNYTHTPAAILYALAERKDELRGVVVQSSGNSVPVGWWSEPGWGDSLLAAPNFLNGVQRVGIERRTIDFMVVDYGLMAKACHIDVILMGVTPPDRHGFCSFGPSVWYHRMFLEQARTVICEVKEDLPYLGGDTMIHASQITHFTEPQPELNATPHPPRVAGEERMPEMEGVAAHAATLVRDGDTIQIGAGIPGDVVAQYLAGKEDLGIHTEVMYDGLVELVRLGVANGRRKTRHRGKAVGAYIEPQTPEMRDYVAGNAAFESYGLEYTNDPLVIAAHDNMTAINFALSIDLTGQVAAESLGHRMWSATGGQMDFVIGAMLAKGGRSLTCLPSTARGGTISRIVPRLEPGTVVTVPRSWVNYVVTEHGIVDLQGKTQRQRAMALISVAHPDFRAELTAEAHRLYWP